MTEKYDAKKVCVTKLGCIACHFLGVVRAFGGRAS